MSKTFYDRALEYAKGVVSGQIVTNKWVKLACQRHMDDLKASKKRGAKYYFDEDEANRVCNFISLLPHTKGKWAQLGEKITLENWQCFFVCCVFGWRSKITGKRRFRKAYFKVPRKNGKSILLAAIGLYMLVADNEYGAEVYSGATTEKQALEIFKPAKLMLEKTEALRKLVGAEVWAKVLLVPVDGSKFEPVIGKPGDGPSPSCALIDEYHEHDSNDMVDTMETGMGAREQPLLLTATTSGYNLGGPCYEHEVEAQKVLEKVYENDELFALMYGIDEGDDWASDDVIYKANPNIGVSVDADFLLSQQRQAINNPVHQTRFRTKHLNEWVGAKTAWMNMFLFNRAADYTLRREQFKGCENWIALDLASTSDICAVVQVFKKQIDGKDHYYVFGKYFLPEDAIQNAVANKDIYVKNVIEGFLEQHDGAEIEYDLVKDHIESLIAEYNPKEILFDPWKAAHIAQQLMNDGAVCVEYRQKVDTMSPPMKELDSAVKAGRFHHDGNPLYVWMMSNVVARLDAKDNIYPRKEKPERKIDGPVATIMALGRAMSGEPPINLDEAIARSRII